MAMFPSITIGKVTYNSIEVSWENDKKTLHHIQISKARSSSPSPGAPALDPLTNYQGYGNSHVFKSLEPNTEYLCRSRFVDGSQQTLGHGAARWSQPNHVFTAKEPPSGAELHKAVARQDLDQVRKILSENNSVVEVMDKFGLTPLMVAAQKGYIDVMETLLEFGADPNYFNSSGKTCMMISCYSGQEEPAKLLRERGVEWGSRDKNGLTSVHWAADGGHDDLLLWMLKDGAQVDLEDTYNGWTPLMRVACLSGNDEVAEVLIAKGADVNRTDKSRKDRAYGGLHERPL
ncbi:predicted protein [Nematostella vectensis]|uniref:Fibronectin type 3 and ankyrin repeat domains protein 1 n=1 Tax=Nematostella vectensis TaxID=45351 RepID=A7SK80_NEMVE|nr:predicted protein [Nematostella vectensis]|eukprot:XP_001627973.1 predicted protein [Nematostella vectensis]